jgi:uncharacterized protein YjdB
MCAAHRRGSVLALLFLASCSDCRDVSEPPTFSSCETGPILLPRGTTLEVWDTATFRVEMQTRECHPVAISSPVTWSTSAPQLVNMSSETTSRVKITAIAVGRDTLYARLASGQTLQAPIGIVPAVPARVTVTAPSTTVPTGGQMQLSAIVTNARGVLIPNEPIAWGSSDSNIASMSPLGILVAGSVPGTVTITAIANDARGSLQIVVRPSAVDRLEVTPAAASVQVDQSVQLTAVMRDAAGNVITGHTVTWESSRDAVATVSSSGSVRGVAPGFANVSASVEGKRATSVITVTAAGTASGRFAYALADNPTAASYTASALTAFNSSGMPIRITRPSTGRYYVNFDGLQPTAAQNQVVQVTSSGPGTGMCSIDEVTTNAQGVSAAIDCYDLNNARIDLPFNILLLGNNALPGRFAFGHASQRTASEYVLASAHSSSAQSPRATRRDGGEYHVTFGGLARAAGAQPEIVLVTAAGPTAGRCTPSGFLVGERQDVHCVGDGTAASDYDDPEDDMNFTVALLERGQPGRRFALAAFTGRGGAPIAGRFFSSSGGAVSESRLGTGRSDVTFQGLGRTPSNGTESVQVMSLSDAGDFCKLLAWRTVGTDLVVSVQCFDKRGPAEDREFVVLVMQ